jgi:hypothetical protein
LLALRKLLSARQMCTSSSGSFSLLEFIGSFLVNILLAIFELCPIYWLLSMVILKYQMVYCSGSQPGVRVPLEVREEATGGTRRAHKGTQNSKNLTQIKLIWVEFFIWGYAKGMGVRRGVQFWFGGTRVPKGWEPLVYCVVLKAYCRI